MPYRRAKLWGNIKPPVGSVVDWGDPINAGLQSCCLFAENGGKLAQDSSAATRLASLGAATVTLGSPGKFGLAAKFDGSAGYLLTPTFGFPYKQCSFSAWINQTTTALNQRNTVFDCSNANTSGCPSFETQGTSSSGMALQIIIPGVFLLTAAGSAQFLINTWVHVTYVIDDAITTATVYVNGVSVASNNYGAQTFASSSQQKNIGRRSNASQFFPGSEDNLRLYSRALRLPEIKRLYAEPFAGIVASRRRVISQGAAGQTAVVRNFLTLGVGG